MFLEIVGGVAIGEIIAGFFMSIVAAKLNRRNARKAQNMVRSFAKLHETERGK